MGDDLNWETLEQDDDEVLQGVVNKSHDVQTLMDQVQKLRGTAAQLHARAEELEREADRICQRELPELFLDLHIHRMEGPGFTAFLTHVVSATIKDKDGALHWLESIGAQDLIKTQINLALPRGLADQARRILDFASTLGASGEAKQGVHAQTLSKWFKERFGSGKTEVPESIAVFDAQVVKFRAKVE